MPRCVALLGHTDFSVVLPALRIVGNVISGTDAQTQAAIDAGALKALVPLLQCRARNVRREACWAVSNAAAGTVSQITQLMTVPGLVAAVVSLLKSGEWNVRKEAAWVVSNIATTGTPDHVRQLVAAGMVGPLVDVLQTDDARMLCLVLDAIAAVLKVETMALRGGGGECGFIALFEEAGLTTLLEEKQDHDNEDVYNKCVAMIETYFSGDEEGGAATAAATAAAAATLASGSFAFGLPPGPSTAPASSVFGVSVFGGIEGGNRGAANTTPQQAVAAGGVQQLMQCAPLGSGAPSHFMAPTQLFASPAAALPAAPSGFSFSGVTFV